jgi:predicted dehydrogenase
MTAPLRLGILGAARIAPNALIKPARIVNDVQVVAVGARDAVKAKAFAQKHRIPRVVDSYDALVNDPNIDAIYNPLPNSLHHEWTIKALRAGKHVLCEKPLASNEREAEEMSRAADETGRVLMEAFHYRYHPLAQRVQEILASGVLGTIRTLQADFFIPLFFRRNDIRFNYQLAGGAMMDTGCYCINLLRWLGGEPQVLSAQPILAAPQVDRVMRAELLFERGVTGYLNCSLAAFPPVKIYAKVVGETGELGIINPFVPQVYNLLQLKTKEGTRYERVTREPTYNFQLRAFVAATRGESTNLTNGRDGIKNMRVIDAVYEKAGLKARGAHRT